jgi:hypothetical protein
LLSELLSIPMAAPASSLTPAQRKAATIALLVDEITRAANSWRTLPSRPRGCGIRSVATSLAAVRSDYRIVFWPDGSILKLDQLTRREFITLLDGAAGGCPSQAFGASSI